MPTRGIITIDMGTTSVRSVLFDQSGQVICSRQRDNPPTFMADGRVEQDPSSWRAAVVETLRDCASAAEAHGCPIPGLSLTSQRSSVVPVDRDGMPLHPAIMWQDRRTKALCESMADDAPFVHRRSGLTISPVFSAVKMAWLKREQPDAYRRAFKLIGVHDFVLHLLTGAFVTDSSLGSRTNLLDLAKRDWDPELIFPLRSRAQDSLRPDRARQRRGTLGARDRCRDGAAAEVACGFGRWRSTVCSPRLGSVLGRPFGGQYRHGLLPDRPFRHARP